MIQSNIDTNETTLNRLILEAKERDSKKHRVRKIESVYVWGEPNFRYISPDVEKITGISIENFKPNLFKNKLQNLPNFISPLDHLHFRRYCILAKELVLSQKYFKEEDDFFSICFRLQIDKRYVWVIRKCQFAKDSNDQVFAQLDTWDIDNIERDFVQCAFSFDRDRVTEESRAMEAFYKENLSVFGLNELLDNIPHINAMYKYSDTKQMAAELDMKPKAFDKQNYNLRALVKSQLITYLDKNKNRIELPQDRLKVWTGEWDRELFKDLLKEFYFYPQRS